MAINQSSIGAQQVHIQPVQQLDSYNLCMQKNEIVSTKTHCQYCFEVLIARLTKQALPPWPKDLPSTPVPLFVTWTYTKTHDLRGCIGTFSHQQLHKVLPEYALISALNDDRFDPISIDEIEHLTVSVSLLINFVKHKKALDWEVGKHGIQIEFSDKNRVYRSTFLPEVASEQNWNKDQTLKHLVRKAGYRGDYREVLEKISLTTYESSKATLSYDEYKATINK